MRKIVALCLLILCSANLGASLYVPELSWTDKNFNVLELSKAIALETFGLSVIAEWFTGGTALEDTDVFKQMIIEECAAVGVDLQSGYFVKISASSFIEEMRMGAARGGIYVAYSIYEEYRRLDADKESIRFLVRHEATHIKNKDVYKRAAFKIGASIGLLYGTGYILNKGIENNLLSDEFNHLPLQNAVKALSLILVAPLTNYFCIYNQEMHADQGAACDPVLAKGGIRFFEHQTEKGKTLSPILKWLKTKPFLIRLIFGYPTDEIRIKALEEAIERSQSFGIEAVGQAA